MREWSSARENARDGLHDQAVQQLLSFKILLGYKRCFKNPPDTSPWDVLSKQKTQIQQVLCALLELTRMGWSWFTVLADGGMWTLVIACFPVVSLLV